MFRVETAFLMEGGERHNEDDAVSWTRNAGGDYGNSVEDPPKQQEEVDLASFRTMLDGDWYTANPTVNHHEMRYLSGFSTNPAESLLLQQPTASSSLCSLSQAFTINPSQSQPFSSLLNVACNNPFENAFDFGSEAEPGIFGQVPANQAPNLMGFAGLSSQINSEMSSGSEFLSARLLPAAAPENGAGLSGDWFTPTSLEGFDNSVDAMFVNRPKVLKPLEVFTSSGMQPTLFQKRAAMRQNSENKLVDLDISGMMKSQSNEREVEEGGFEVSGLNYESDELNETQIVDESGRNSVEGGGDRKGKKKKGMPAKNLMAERRRRKKLNDRLYMLRSVVPKISKMDRASILGDAIDYLKELLQRINDLHNELESTPPGSMPPSSSSFHPLTPTPRTLPCRIKEELCPSSLPSPKGQQARVEVTLREGRAVNIHMFCGRRPGLLLSTMRALDNLGLDIQQAVISCFNGFALDVFRAEQCREGEDILPEQIKAVLLETAGYPATL